MNDITLGQVVIAIGTITALWVFAEKVLKGIEGMFTKHLAPLTSDMEMLKDITYQMLDHMATNNNTGGMKKVLDEYNRYNRHN